ncbi:MAG: hypothetical protein H6Q13_2325 [Bacteroidetes bacterium]|nr:hypothetical protein [Bacteroidota bacterium]
MTEKGLENMSPADFLKKGYVLIPRLLIEQAEKTAAVRNEADALIAIITQVNYKDEMCSIEGQSTLCKRGESLHSLQKWADLFHWRRGKTRHFFAKMQRLKIIKLLPHPKTTHLRVIDYELWTGAQSSGFRQLKAEQDEEFDQFWNSYHEITESRKLNVGRARREWNLLNGEEKKQATENIEEYYYNLTDIHFCKQAATYLRDKSFLDED